MYIHIPGKVSRKENGRERVAGKKGIEHQQPN
jgi:hypothetical protein